MSSYRIRILDIQAGKELQIIRSDIPLHIPHVGEYVVAQGELWRVSRVTTAYEEPVIRVEVEVRA